MSGPEIRTRVARQMVESAIVVTDGRHLYVYEDDREYLILLTVIDTTTFEEEDDDNE